MPFALITIGILLLVTALNNTAPAFAKQVSKDMFSEDGGFIYWVAALVIVGLLGYVPSLKKPADLFMLLIIVAMLLKNSNFFQQFQQGIAGIGAAASAGGSSTASSASPTLASQGSAYGGLFSGPLGTIIAQQQTASDAGLLVTTPQPIAGGTPLGQGGIGAA